MNEDDDKSPDSVLRISFINLYISIQNNFQSNHSKLNQLKHIYIYMYLLSRSTLFSYFFSKREGEYTSPPSSVSGSTPLLIIGIGRAEGKDNSSVSNEDHALSIGTWRDEGGRTTPAVDASFQERFVDRAGNRSK